MDPQRAAISVARDDQQRDQIPAVVAITAAAILGRSGDPNRFTSLAGARAFTGLVPALAASGLNSRHGGPTKRGDAALPQALFMSAGQARRDPTQAAKYHRLMIDAGNTTTPRSATSPPPC
jgi:transposase